ncbi:MAG: hypothetical protein IPI24_13625 [Ignavibacteria bacterium]|nr:hypothetical protein [Ignavibacteria bacterium]
MIRGLDLEMRDGRMLDDEHGGGVIVRKAEIINTGRIRSMDSFLHGFSSDVGDRS